MQGTKEEQGSQKQEARYDESANATTDEFDDALFCSLDSPVDS